MRGRRDGRGAGAARSRRRPARRAPAGEAAEPIVRLHGRPGGRDAVRVKGDGRGKSPRCSYSSPSTPAGKAYVVTRHGRLDVAPLRSAVPDDGAQRSSPALSAPDSISRAASRLVQARGGADRQPARHGRRARRVCRRSRSMTNHVRRRRRRSSRSIALAVVGRLRTCTSSCCRRHVQDPPLRNGPTRSRPPGWPAAQQQIVGGRPGCSPRPGHLHQLPTGAARSACPAASLLRRWSASRPASGSCQADGYPLAPLRPRGRSRAWGCAAAMVTRFWTTTSSPAACPPQRAAWRTASASSAGASSKAAQLPGA